MKNSQMWHLEMVLFMIATSYFVAYDKKVGAISCGIIAIISFIGFVVNSRWELFD